MQDATPIAIPPGTLAALPSMHLDVRVVAQWFLSRSIEDWEYGDLMSHYRLQKFVYYAEAWSLALHGRSLYEDPILPWFRGPFVPALYECLLPHGDGPLHFISISDEDLLEAVDETTFALLEWVWRAYSPYSTRSLEDTIKAELPYRAARGELSPEVNGQQPMSRNLMASYYAGLQAGVSVEGLDEMQPLVSGSAPQGESNASTPESYESHRLAA